MALPALTLPQTTTDLRQGLGLAFLYQQFRSVGMEPPEQALRRSMEGANLEMANQWLSHHATVVLGLNQLAGRALMEAAHGSEAVMNAFMPELLTAADDVRALFESSPDSYLMKLVRLALSHDEGRGFIRLMEVFRDLSGRP